MNNLIILVVIIITILLIFGVNLILKPETRKKGIFIISSIIILLIIRYCYINYTFMGINYFVDSLTEDLSEILQGLIMVTFFSQPICIFNWFIFDNKRKKIPNHWTLFYDWVNYCIYCWIKHLWRINYLKIKK